MKAPRPLPAFLRNGEIRALLGAGRRHDAETFSMTRTEKREALHGSTPRHPPIADFVVTVLLTGARVGEVLGLTWREVDLDGPALLLDAERVKTRFARRVDLSLSPAVVEVLRRLRLASGDARAEARVFSWLTPGAVAAARKRLMRDFGAPRFDWQGLRRTAATYLTNAPFAGPWASARRLGHSVIVAERHYAGLLPDIPESARTLEAAMGIEDTSGIVAASSKVPDLIPRLEKGL